MSSSDAQINTNPTPNDLVRALGDMLHPEVALELIYPDAIMPTFATEGAACVDLHAYDPIMKKGQQIAIEPGETRMVGTGIKIAVPKGYVAKIYPRSGNANKHNVCLANGTGIIDSDFRGEIQVMLHRLRYVVVQDTVQAGTRFFVAQGDRIAQLSIEIAPAFGFYLVKKLDETERGEKGFGSTGQESKIPVGTTSAPAVIPVTSPPPSDFSKMKEQAQQLPASLQPVFRALTANQRERLLRMSVPAEALRMVEDLQDRSEWDIPANFSHPQPISYSTAFDLLFPEKERAK